MTDKAFSTLASRVEGIATGAPRPMVINAIRRAARRVCEKTLAWRYMIPLFDLVPGVHEYAFNVPTNADVEHVFGVLVNGRPLDLLTLDTALFQYPAWADLYSGEDAETVWSETPGGYIGAGTYDSSAFDAGSDYVLPDAIVADASYPRACVMLNPQRFIILPLPDGEDTYVTRMFVALKPKTDATDMDYDTFEELEDPIFHHTMNGLFVMKGKPWSDKELGAYHLKEYDKFWVEKKARANIGGVRGSMQVRMKPWA